MTTYYVKTGGDDAKSGIDDANAWATVAKVNTELNGGVINAGDDIYFNKGDTFTGTTLAIRVGGTSGNVMTFGSYGTGAKPIIDANNSAAKCIEVLANNIGYITIENLDLRNSTAHALLFYQGEQLQNIFQDLCDVH